MNQLYENILQITKNIKTKIMTELAESFILPIGGIPESITKELDVLASIEGLVIGMLMDRGISLNNEENEGFVNIFINGNTYRTHRSKLPQKGTSLKVIQEENIVKHNHNISNTQDEIIVSEETQTIEESIVEPIVNELKNEEDTVIIFEDEDNSFLPKKNHVSYDDELSAFLEKEDFTIQEDIENEEVIVFEEDVDTLSENNNMSNINIEESTSLNVVEDMVADVNDEINQLSNNNIVENPLLQSKATIIGELPKTPEVSTLSHEFFIEEKYKHSEQFVFDLHRVSVCHMGGRAEDMEIMIAPLKIQKYSCPGVPIIAAVYYQGRMYVASSYDNNEDGKNIIPMEINDYYFLIRGFFNDKGEFQSTITTTGISASQGDLLTPVGLKKHRPIGSKVGNGHIKFKYESEYGPGIVEVFPLDLYEKDFVVMTRNEEFTDYYVISNKGYGINRVLLYDNNIKSELVCNWDGENLEVDIVPV